MHDPQGPTPAATPRFNTVDILRGFSILAVVIHHTFLRFLFAGYPMQHRIPHDLVHLLFWDGNNGVTVFFAVSGFLITFTSLRRFGTLARLNPRTFYRIRFARIAPLLLLLVAILSVLAVLHAPGFTFTGKSASLPRAILAALTFHLNWLEARYGWLPANWDILWSLSVEEMFYLFFPLVCLACFHFRRTGLALFLLVLATFIAMGPFARSTWTTNEIWREKTYLGGMDAIALGCLTALLTAHLAARQNSTWPRTHKSLLLLTQITGAAILITIAIGPRWFWKLFPTKLDPYGTLIAFATCLVMLASTLRSQGSVLPSAARIAKPMDRLTAPIRWYGRHSYEVYLTHEFIVIGIVFLFLHFHPNPDSGSTAPHQAPVPQMVLWFATVLLLTVPLGYLTARFFSEPLNRRLRGASPPPA